MLLKSPEILSDQAFERAKLGARRTSAKVSTGSPGGYSQKNWVGVCGPLPKTLTLFMTKICDIPYPIYDLTKNSKPNL